MRKPLLRLSALVGLVVAIGACGDSPMAANQPHDLSTAEGTPLLDQTVQGCVTDGACTLEPVSPVPGDPVECDPYTSLDWCGDDGDCLSSGPAPDGPDYQGTAGCGEPREPDGYKPPPSTAPKPCPDYGCPDEPPPADTCHTGEAMVDDPDVHGQFDVLWQQSLSQGAEMGGWIVQDGPSNYRLIPFQNAVNTPCGVDVFEPPPSNLVSMFHTHPWTLGQARTCDGTYTRYFGTPSPEDVQTLQQLGLSTGYFIDHKGVGKYTATTGEQAIRIDRCGY